MKKYSPMMTSRIVRAFRDRNVGIYDTGMTMTKEGGKCTMDDVVEPGHIEGILKRDKVYALLKRKEKGDTVDDLKRNLYSLLRALNGEIPTMVIKGNRVPVPAFTLNDSYVGNLVRGHGGIAYEDFLEGIRTYPDFNDVQQYVEQLRREGYRQDRVDTEFGIDMKVVLVMPVPFWGEGRTQSPN
ncbi:MAG: hypothetical protein JSW08_03340 [archaeon]|nr:MAG: hypothetical protein JSW08_03340 [archaeon]